MGDEDPSTLSGLFFVGCAGLLAAGITAILRFRFSRRVRSWRAASGVVIKVKEFDDDDGGWVEFMVRFTDDHGLEHVLSNLRDRGPPYPYVEGNPILVVYPPGKPEKARPGIPRHLYRGYKVAMIVSLVFSSFILAGFLPLFHRSH